MTGERIWPVFHTVFCCYGLSMYSVLIVGDVFSVLSFYYIFIEFDATQMGKIICVRGLKLAVFSSL